MFICCGDRLRVVVRCVCVVFVWGDFVFRLGSLV